MSSFNFGTEINPQYLDKIYEDLSREQMKLLSDLKTDVSTDISKDVLVQKQLTLINNIVVSVLRLRNIKKKTSLSV
tara:strand:+ start:657 stop:884 length:228 start_codon:yes stop_codon:yes gene_type:complete